MNERAVVFDFNGTLFWDTKQQNDSWDQFLTKYNFRLSAEEKTTWVHGINAKDTFEYLFKRECTDDEVFRLTEEKEVIYREMCLEGKMELAPGAQSLIGFLKSNGIKIAIATAAGKNNVEFFIEHFNLLAYFDRENIIYNDGTVRGKPHPDLFNKAIEQLRVDKKQVTIFEDSLAGIEAAKNSGAGNVVVVNGNNEHHGIFNFPVIKDFNEFDRSVFN